MEDFPECAVCGRTILHGERVSEYVDSNHEIAGVCALCKPRAEASGWIPAARAGMATRAAESRRPALGLNLRRRFARRGSAEESDSAGATQTPRETPAPVTLDVFNASHEVRKVAGLTRSLGAPCVSVRGEVVTVAWDLSWYQWRVNGNEVEEIAKGSEVSELSEADRAWNASAADDGTISLA